MLILPYESGDDDALWGILQPVFAAGDTYAVDPGISREQALSLWTRLPQATFVMEADGQVLGTYYLKANQAGGGSHVCNCGYVVAEASRGRGVAAALCQHSLSQARQLGFLAMQFNLVVESNTTAIRLWQKLGFAIVGTLPGAFRHPRLGLVGAHVMYQWLGESAAITPNAPRPATETAPAFDRGESHQTSAGPE